MVLPINWNSIIVYLYNKKCGEGKSLEWTNLVVNRTSWSTCIVINFSFGTNGLLYCGGWTWFRKTARELLGDDAKFRDELLRMVVYYRLRLLWKKKKKIYGKEWEIDRFIQLFRVFMSNQLMSLCVLCLWERFIWYNFSVCTLTQWNGDDGVKYIWNDIAARSGWYCRQMDN